MQVTYLFHFVNVWILLKTGGNIKYRPLNIPQTDGHWERSAEVNDTVQRESHKKTEKLKITDFLHFVHPMYHT